MRRVEIIFGGWTFHIEEYKGQVTGYASSFTYQKDTETMTGSSTEEVLGKLVMEVIN